MPQKIVHIINPVKVNENSDLFFAQPITFESIKKAVAFSKNPELINVVSTQYEEDIEIIPSHITKLSNLTRSVNDCNPKLIEKKLPLIKDILAKIDEIEIVDYVVYTNMDIALQPNFYDFIQFYIEQGNDAIIVNRRRISKTFTKVEELPILYAEFGKSHPGFDCFVFKKELLTDFIFDEICIGVPFLEVSFVHNLFSFAKNPIFLPDVHLTFHLGLEVMPKIQKDYYWHNRTVFFKKINPLLKSKYKLNKFPYSQLPFPKRAFKWLLNPSLFTRTYIELEQKSFLEKVKYYLNEVRWRLLQR